MAPDIVYFRYPLADETLLHFVRAHPHIVFEHNTIEEAELQGHARHEERRYGARVIAGAAGACCVTDEILRYERGRAGVQLRGMVMGNGMAVETVVPPRFELPDDAVHMLCASHFAPWHGVDRLLRGMKAHTGTTPFVLHLAGKGAELGRYALLARELGITAQVRIHGFCQREELDALTSRCHVAVGALGIHRKALGAAAAIKVREYCAQGIPFILSGTDPDFDPLPDFARSVPNDDSPVDMRVVLELAQAVREKPQLREDMRRYAEERLDWRVKTRHMADFLAQCVRRKRPREAQEDLPLHGLLVPELPDANGALLETLCPREAGVPAVLEAHARVARMPDAWQARLREVLTASPRWALGHFWQGLVHEGRGEGRGEVREALVEYLVAAQASADVAWQAAFRLALCYAAQGNRAKARAFMAMSVEQEPALGPVFRGLGW